MNTPLRKLAGVVAVLFASLFASSTYIQFIDAGTLGSRSDNLRAMYKEYSRQRGQIVVAGQAIAQSDPVDDTYKYLRSYPGGEMYSAVTGYYSVTSNSSTGIEAAENDLLAGTSDELFYRRISDMLTGRQPEGATVELTIDPDVQQAAWDALGDQKGSVVAIDPSTGAILAMVSKPSYDADDLASHDSSAVSSAYSELLADEDDPLYNRAIAGDQYPPGSVFKLVTAAAAIESGDYDADTEVEGPATLDLPGTTADLPNDWDGACGTDGSGTLTLTEALAESCNTAFGQIGMDLGEDALAEQAGKFGFGEDLSVPLTVTPSSFPTGLTDAQVAQSAIGQYDVRVTPLQIAMVCAAIANDGTLMTPYLVKDVVSSDLDEISTTDPQEFSDPISSDTADQLTTMMEAVVSGGTGTAAQIDGVTVAGKSGTAEQGEEESPHAWFTSFAPADDPQIAVAVVVEDGGTAGDETSGGKVAAPIAKKVMEAVLS